MAPTASKCDVRMSRDGHLVCVHDRSVDRTSDGRGLVSRHTLAQLRALDWSGPDSDVDHTRGESEDRRLVTLAEVADLVRGANRPVALDITLVRRHLELVARHQARRHGVYVWTVNEAVDLRLCMELGVDAVITNDPAEALAVFGARG